MPGLSRHGARLSLILAMAAAALVVLAGGARSQAGQPLTVSPPEGAAFTVVTVSGGDCAGTSPFVNAFLFRVGGDSVAGASFQVVPDGGGDWAGSFTVPPGVAPGAYEVRATCFPDDSQAGEDYQPEPFTVLASETQPVLTVSPRQAEAGRDVVLSAAGTLCRGEDAGIRVLVSLEGGDPDEFPAQAEVEPDAEGDWSLQLTIPGSTPPGTYQVAAICSLGSETFFSYLPAPTIVLTSSATTPPAVAVPGRPRFTG